MNLYLVSQEVNTGYDVYDSMVVAAENEEQARRISPSPFYKWSDEHSTWMFVYSDGRLERDSQMYSWTDRLDDIKVKLIGKADKEVAGVILASFNAG